MPQSFSELAQWSDTELFTREAADRRQAAEGRYMVKWQDGYQRYQHTPFGRMEYLLDRDDNPATRIDA